jgi:predicted Fe-Mo cluster-binding NifX family protein
MVIAIPLFHTRVAPRFDCSRVFLLAETDGHGRQTQRYVTFAAGSAQKRIEALCALGVNTLICGGIDTHTATLLSRSEIRVIAWVAGEAEDALLNYRSGELTDRSIIGREGRCSGRWAFQERFEGFSVQPPTQNETRDEQAPAGHRKARRRGNGPGNGRKCE